MRQKSTKQVFLLILSFVLVVLTIAACVLLLGSWAAWFFSDSTFGAVQLGPFALDLPKLKKSIEATGASYAALFELLALGVTWRIAKLAKAVWLKATVDIGNSPPPSPDKLRHQRDVLIRNVTSRLHNIENQQPYSHAFVELKKQKCTECMARYFDMPSMELPVLEIFDHAQGWILILGEAAAGKSTTLNQLAFCLLERTNSGATELMPVVLSLSRWKAKHKTFREWLIEELHSVYRISKEVGNYWIEEQKLIFLLDAIDEIRSGDARRSCIDAINVFGTTCLAQMAISSRKNEYDVTGRKLDVRAAFMLKPLDNANINSFLSRVGKEGKELTRLLKQHAKLMDLARIPLLLNMMVGSVSELNKVNFAANTKGKLLQQQVLDAFIRERLGSEQISRRYLPSRVVTYLKFLAQSQKTTGETAFIPELAGEQLVLVGRRKQLENSVGYGVMFVGSALFAYELFTRVLNLSNKPPVRQDYPIPFGYPTFFAMSLLTVGVLLAFFRYVDKKTGVSLLTQRPYLERLGSTYLLRILFYFVACATLVTIYEAITSSNYQGMLFYGGISLMFLGAQLQMAFPHLYGALAGQFPYRIKPFMQYCVDLKFMYRIGPGFSFIHSLLQEHFAELDPARLHLEDLDAQYHAAKRAREK